MKLAIAGASGFVGQALLQELQSEHNIVALSRIPKSASAVEWRKCDLFNLVDVETALVGCDVGIYLAHSHRPSAQLTQASLADLELIAAENFIQAAEKNGLRHLIFLGQEHLTSEIPITHLRSSLGPGGEGGDSLSTLDEKRSKQIWKAEFPQGAKEVHSVQRMQLPKGMKAIQVVDEYFDFLPRVTLGLIRVQINGAEVNFSWRYPLVPLLKLRHSLERSGSERQLFYLEGGLLAQKTRHGRLEFRTTRDGKSVIAEIHEFKPRMPWFLYLRTQALIHLWVMRKFELYLNRIKTAG